MPESPANDKKRLATGGQRKTKKDQKSTEQGGKPIASSAAGRLQALLGTGLRPGDNILADAVPAHDETAATTPSDALAEAQPGGSEHPVETDPMDSQPHKPVRPVVPPSPTPKPTYTPPVRFLKPHTRPDPEEDFPGPETPMGHVKAYRDDTYKGRMMGGKQLSSVVAAVDELRAKVAAKTRLDKPFSDADLTRACLKVVLLQLEANKLDLADAYRGETRLAVLDGSKKPAEVLVAYLSKALLPDAKK